MRAPSPTGGPGIPSIAAAIAIFGSAGCVIETQVGSDVPERARVASVPSSFKHDLDLLFVVDDRADLADIRAETTALWRRVRGNLAFAEGGFPSVRIGVVSSDLGVGVGKVGGCTASGGDGALRPGHDGSLWFDVDGAGAEMSDVELGVRLTLPDAGCPYDQPIGALERALDGSQPLNDGFLRDGAALGIVIVGGDDDCSVDDPAFWVPDASGEPVAPFRCFREAVHCSGDDVYSGVQNGCIARQAPPHLVDAGMTAAFLRDLRPDAESVVVTGIIGDKDQVEIVEQGGELSLDSACDDPARPLLPGVRLAGFVRDMGGTTAGVCKAPVESAGAATGLDLRDALGHRCLEGEIADVDPAPGLQVDCAVTALDATGVQRELAACPNPNNVIDAAGPCWAIKDGAGQCGDFPSGLSLQVNWGGDDPMTQPAGVTALVSCVVEPTTPP